MLLTYTTSPFDVPEGQYVGKFLGLEMLEPRPGEGPRRGPDGREMQPAMAWRWEIVGGDSAGRIADRVSSRSPTPKNVAGRLLSAITGLILREGDNVELGEYVGKYYRLSVVKKPNGTGGTYVSETNLIRLPDDEVARLNGAVPSTPRFWLKESGGTPALKTRDEVHDFVKAGAKLAELQLCPEGGPPEFRAAADVLPELASVEAIPY